MNITSIMLDRFKPMMHGGITHFEAEFPAQVTVILGINGSGKSYLLNELTPLPATRSYFDTDGKKVITLEHERSTYVLTSDFSERSHPHSFKKDGVELNESGATEAQTDLVFQCFGFTPLLQRVMAHNVRMSTMGRMERRAFFMATYPSDMTFIQDHHKRICSQIRTFNGNLKMLSERQVDLQTRLLDHTQRDQLAAMKADLVEYLGLLDQALITVQQNTEFYQVHPAYAGYETPNAPLKVIEEELDHAYKVLAKFKCDLMLRSGNSTVPSVDVLTHTVTHLDDRMGSYQEQAEYLRSEMEHLQSILALHSGESLDQLKLEAQKLTSKLQELTVDPMMPIVPEDQLTEVYTRLAKLGQKVLELQGSGVKLLTQPQLEALRAEIMSVTLAQASAQQHLAEVNTAIDALIKRKEREARYGFPKGCAMDCEMKNALIDVLYATDKEMEELSIQKGAYEAEVQKTSDRLQALETAFRGPWTHYPLFKAVETEIVRLGWENHLVASQPLIYRLNTAPQSLIAECHRLFENSKVYWVKAQYERDLSVVSAKILTMEQTHIPSKDLVERSLADKLTRQNDLVHRLTHLSELKASTQEQISRVIGCTRAGEDATTWCDRMMAHLNYLLVRTHLQFNSGLIKELKEKKGLVHEKVRTLETTLKEQEGYLTRLTEEILPTITTITLKRDRWQLVEQALSPSQGGIPHDYMIRYINNLIKLVNKYIRSVWGYPLEVDYLDGSKSLEFDLGFTLYGSSQLKDIGMGSTGQQAIFNLAFTLALCEFHGYGKRYPLQLDEIDANLNPGHQTKLIDLVNQITQEHHIDQLFMVNQFASLYTGFQGAEYVVLNEQGISLPARYNDHVKIR